MAISLPREFKNIPLTDLWTHLRISDELLGLSASDTDKQYWKGWHDCMAVLLGDLTNRPTITSMPELSDLFQDFRMEDRLRAMEAQMNEDGDL